MRARFYNPEIRRFVNMDPLLGSIVDGQSLNRYAYVGGDPVSGVDPLGLYILNFTGYGKAWKWTQSRKDNIFKRFNEAIQIVPAVIKRLNRYIEDKTRDKRFRCKATEVRGVFKSIWDLMKDPTLNIDLFVFHKEDNSNGEKSSESRVSETRLWQGEHNILFNTSESGNYFMSGRGTSILIHELSHQPGVNTQDWDSENGKLYLTSAQFVETLVNHRFDSDKILGDFMDTAFKANGDELR